MEFLETAWRLSARTRKGSTPQIEAAKVQILGEFGLQGRLRVEAFREGATRREGESLMEEEGFTACLDGTTDRPRTG